MARKTSEIRQRHVQDLTGQRFGRLTAVRRAGVDSFGCTYWFVQCDCGGTKRVRGNSLQQGRTQSCGCIQPKRTSIHGEAWGAKQTREYRAWLAAKQRCTNPKNPEWKNYGGRGITMCEQWRNSYVAFLAYILEHLGRCPSGMSLDRIDNDKGYEPGNIRWATASEQTWNRRVCA
jgi:hypothetical protein